MGLSFEFQISNLVSKKSPSRIGLRDFDVSFLNSDVNCRRFPAVDYLIDVHLPCRGIRGQRDIIEIIGDFSICNAGEEVEACFAGQKDPGISLSDVYMRRELFLLPPIVPERERAAVHCKIQVRET